MKIYIGTRSSDGACVMVGGPGLFAPLASRCDLMNHSPTGFEWGYGGSGPAQLALALLADVLGDRLADALYQDFKWEVVAKLPFDGWRLTEEEICEWAARQEIEEVDGG